MDVVEVDFVYSKFVPLVFDFLIGGTATVRRASAKCIAAATRRNLTEKQRTNIYVRLLRDFWNSPSYAARISFIDVADCILHNFSAHFFKVKQKL